MPKSLICLFLLAISLLFPNLSHAQEFFFQEEFNESRPDNSLDTNKWNTFPNNQGSFATIKEFGGNISLNQQNNTNKYPYAITKNQALPGTDYSAEIKFQYTKITPWGAGIILTDIQPPNGSDQFQNLININVWQDSSIGPALRIGFDGSEVFSTPITTAPHTLKVDRVDKRYLIYFDGILTFTSNETNEVVKYIFIGNPGIVPFIIPQWTTYNVDYIRVTQTAPQPFLDLPWDYESDARTFEQQAFNPFSWFDHQYPLQNFCCDPPVLTYSGELKNAPYKSHSGYDYSAKNGVKFHTPVLAAASGEAIFIPQNKSHGAGNMIKIDHKNGYQTWYEHLDNNGLIINTEGQKANITLGQQIGLVGMTGNTTGPHIHFSVFKDLNKNGNFNDDYPYGLTDPLGWEGINQDPWELYGSGGTKSYKLFTKLNPPKNTHIPTTGGSLTSQNTTVNIPSGASNSNLNLKYRDGPFEKATEFITSTLPSFFLDAVDNLGNTITNFNKPVEIITDYSKADLNNIDENSLKLYTYNPQTDTWEELSSSLDKNSKTVKAYTTHFSQFALMGIIKDLTPPITKIVISGDKGFDNWYKSDTILELKGQDNVDGLGLEYTLYSLNNSDWFKYENPITLSEEGSHQITYLSIDKADNREEIKTTEFKIDKTIPEAKISIDQNIYDLVVTNLDSNPGAVTRIPRKMDDATFEIKDLAGNILKLETKDLDRKDYDLFKLYSTQYNNNPKTPQADNALGIIYIMKPRQENPLRISVQDFYTKNLINLFVTYDSSKNKSTIITTEYRKKPVSQTLPGPVFLQLKTNQGKLEYSY